MSPKKKLRAVKPKVEEQDEKNEDISEKPKVEGQDEKDVEINEESNVDAKDAAPEEPALVMQVDQASEELVTPKDVEQDAPQDSRPKLSANTVTISPMDCTMNVIPAFGGKLLTSFRDSGLFHLVACARANVGMKSGRYLIESTIVEQMGAVKSTIMRMGLTLQGAPLFLDDREENVFFDSSGWWVSGACRTKVLGVSHCNRGSNVGMLVNLDCSSPNAHTVSIFVDGSRCGEPYPLPEAWKGKAVFPTFAYKGVALGVNFGPAAKSPLPFPCRMFGDAAQDDVELAMDMAALETGKYEAVFPICLPEHGALDWADDFLAKNPSYTEISARKLREWAAKSGLSGPNGEFYKYNDHIHNHEYLSMDLTRMLKTLAVDYYPRNLLIMELKNNLIPHERKTNLDLLHGFKKTAAVLMGEPSREYKEMIQDQILAEKKAAKDLERNRGKEWKDRRAKLADQKRQAELLAANRSRARLAESMDASKNDEEAKEPEPEAEEPKEKMVPVSEEPEEPEEPVVLTEEEKAIVSRQGRRDLDPTLIPKIFTSFALPSVKEGFDDIKYLWEDEEGSKDAFHSYIRDHKLSKKVENLKPGAWFHKESQKMQTQIQQWRTRANEWKNPITRKKLLAALLAERKEAMKTEGTSEDVKLPEVDLDAVDVFAVEDVMNLGSGQPLFSKFAAEDWALLTLRLQLHLLVHAFKKDVNDPDRASFHKSQLGFYYYKYFNQNLTLASYGCATWDELLELIEETIQLSPAEMVEAVCEADKPAKHFLQVVEEHRRDRRRRFDAGDETAELAFAKGGNFGSWHPAQPSPALGQQPATGMKRPMLPMVPATSQWMGGPANQQSGFMLPGSSQWMGGPVNQQAGFMPFGMY